MEGSLNETDLPQILGTLSGVREAGLLTLSGEGTTAKLRIQDGYVLAAMSDGTADAETVNAAFRVPGRTG